MIIVLKSLLIVKACLLQLTLHTNTTTVMVGAQGRCFINIILKSEAVSSFYERGYESNCSAFLSSAGYARPGFLPGRLLRGVGSATAPQSVPPLAALIRGKRTHTLCFPPH